MANRARRPQKPNPDVEWHFFSFPVAAAFFTGMFLAAFILYVDIGFYVDILHIVLVLGPLLFVSWSAAHIGNHLYARRRAQKKRRGEEEDERERRALAARAAAASTEAGNAPRRRRRRRSGGGSAG
jgi:hypothetical protein